jgi:hypothetical protein
MTGLPRGLAIIALMLAATFPAHAGSGRGDHEFRQSGNWSDTHVRYPGDVAYSFGTVRQSGPEQGPYVEHCWWTADSQLFGIPFGFTQHCVRYTNDNTN